MSPYLFVLCMERLGHIIDREVRHGRWKPIKVGRQGSGVSHIFFADDLFLFGRTTQKEANIMRYVLDRFCAASGAKVSLEKSRLFISPKAPSRHKCMMSRLLGVSISNNLGKYLGVPLIHGRVGKGTYRELIEKINSRLSGLKSKVKKQKAKQRFES